MTISPPSPPGLEALMRVSAAVAARDGATLEASFPQVAEEVSREAMEEALLQTYLFVGYPVAMNALAAWRRWSGTVPVGVEGTTPSEWSHRGERVCRAVYGSQYEALRRNVRSLHPDLEEWMVTEGYGKVLGRPGLGLVERELCIVALLAVIRVPTQLYSHLRGALSVGATKGQVERALEVAGEFLPPEGWEEARGNWRKVQERVARREEDGRG